MSWQRDIIDLELELYNRIIVCQTNSKSISTDTANPSSRKLKHGHFLDTSPPAATVPMCDQASKPVGSRLVPQHPLQTRLVQVKIELGHRAVLKTKPNAECHTHDWTVFVRGPEGCDLQHFIEKIVFNLHPTFPKPKRVLKEPPYQVSESGYAGFNVAIDIHFKNKSEPKRIRFMYDLFLKTDDAVNHVRCEKLTFQNPTEDFRRRLLKSGGIGILGGGGEGETLISKTALSTSPKAQSVPVKRPQTVEERAFEDLFGEPIKKEDQVKKKKIAKPEKKLLESPVAGSVPTSKSPAADLNTSASSEKSGKASAKHEKSEKPRSHSHSKDIGSKAEREHSSKPKSGDKHPSHDRHRHGDGSGEKLSQSSERGERHGSSKSAVKRSHDVDEDSMDGSTARKKKKKDKEKERSDSKSKEKEEKKSQSKAKELTRKEIAISQIYSSDSDSDDSLDLERDIERERKRRKEKEMEKRREKEREAEKQKQKEKEMEKKREKEKELERQQKKEREQEKQRELDKQREKEKELEKQKEKERELEKQRDRERELEKQKGKERELEKKKRKEIEEQKEKEREAERQRKKEQREIEKKKQRKLEKQKKEQEEAEKQREKEEKRQKEEQEEKERRRQEKERAKQKEREKETQRELEQKEKERKDKERKKEREQMENEQKEKLKSKEKQKSKHSSEKTSKSTKDKSKYEKQKSSTKHTLEKESEDEVEMESKGDDDVIVMKTEPSPKHKARAKPSQTSLRNDIFSTQSTSDEDPFGDYAEDNDDVSAFKTQESSSGTPKPLNTLLSELDNNSDDSLDDDDILSPVEHKTNLFKKISPPPPNTPGGHGDDVIASKPSSFPRKMKDEIFSDESDSSSSESDSGDDKEYKSDNKSDKSDHESDSEREEGEVISPVKVKKEPGLLVPASDDVIEPTGHTSLKRSISKSPRQAAPRDVLASKESEPIPAGRRQSLSPPSRDTTAVMAEDQLDLASEPTHAHSVQKPPPGGKQRNGSLNKDNVDIYTDTAPNGELLAVLLDLQKRLALLTNKEILQHIVGIIVAAGAGTVNKNSFDFDLCKLDSGTVKLIQTYMEESSTC